MTRRISPTMLAAAVSVSAVGLAASAVAASDRGGNTTDTGILVAYALAVTVGAHVLPAISRSTISRALWLVCLVAVIYGHAAFFAGSAHRAGAERAASVHTNERSRALQEQLDALGARPLPAVSDALAAATARSAQATAALARCDAATPGRCGTARAAAAAAHARVQALTDELAAARRANELRERLTTEAEHHDQRRADAALDPGAAALATLTGMPAGSIQTAAQMLTAVLVELLAAFLWCHALPMPARRHQETPHVNDLADFDSHQWPRPAHRNPHGQEPVHSAAQRSTTGLAAHLDHPGERHAAGPGAAPHSADLRRASRRRPHRGPLAAARPRDSPR